MSLPFLKASIHSSRSSFEDAAKYITSALSPTYMCEEMMHKHHDNGWSVTAVSTTDYTIRIRIAEHWLSHTRYTTGLHTAHIYTPHIPHTSLCIHIPIPCPLTHAHITPFTHISVTHTLLTHTHTSLTHRWQRNCQKVPNTLLKRVANCYGVASWAPSHSHLGTPLFVSPRYGQIKDISLKYTKKQTWNRGVTVCVRC